MLLPSAAIARRTRERRRDAYFRRLTGQSRSAVLIGKLPKVATGTSVNGTASAEAKSVTSDPAADWAKRDGALESQAFGGEVRLEGERHVWH
jgi:hypothetical protein